MGGSYLKFIRKQFFVLFYFFTLLLTIALYCILRGSVYVVAITLLCVALFEFIAYFLFGFLSKKRVTVKLVRLSLLLLFSIVFTMLSNRHGYVPFVAICDSRSPATLRSPFRITRTIVFHVPNTQRLPSSMM